MNSFTGLQGLNGIKKITGSSSNVIIREQTGIRLVFKLLLLFILLTKSVRDLKTNLRGPNLSPPVKTFVTDSGNRIQTPKSTQGIDSKILLHTKIHKFLYYSS